MSISAPPDDPATHRAPAPDGGERSILFAAGPKGQRLYIPSGVSQINWSVVLSEKEPLAEAIQRARVAAAIAAPVTGVSLKELAAGKRRVAILAGDLSRPAPYEIALPVLVGTLIDAGIRPSRIAFFACPGATGALLGRAAIHRYGEEICGEHEVLAWPAEGSPGALFDSADLRIAIVSDFSDVAFKAFLPPGIAVDYFVALQLGQGLQIEIEAARAFIAEPQQAASPLQQPKDCTADVVMLSGGGSPWEETLEEALLSLHAPLCRAATAVLVFSGEEGLGASRFSRDVWSVIEQAEAALAAGKSLGAAVAATAASAYDPVNAFAESLKRHAHTVLFSPHFAEHVDGCDLIDRLEAAPNLSRRLSVCATPTALWNVLTMLHGERFTLHAEPLGWRARVVQNATHAEH